MNDSKLDSQTSSLSDRYSEEKLIPLNLIFTYPVQWSRYKVLRDFIQNFYDAVSHDNWVERFSYSLQQDTLIMEVHDVSFSYDWLVHIGASTKQDKEDQYAGYFGEGFKIASLCAYRDYNWQIAMTSKDWELRVMTSHLEVDNVDLKSLAYLVKKTDRVKHNSLLTLSPFSQSDMELFQCALLSFYYKENPLFGKKIWSGSSGAIYFRSKTPKPSGYPSTSSYNGNGIIFAAFQALGSHPYDLVFCFHNYRSHEGKEITFLKWMLLK